MSVANQAFAFCVFQIPAETARLSAGTSVGRAAADDVTEVTLAAIRDAQRTVDEIFQRNCGL